MNRKAIATGSIVVIILGFLVLLLILNGPLKTGYDYAQEKFFGKRGILSGALPSRESEFQPYSGQIQLSSEEKIVDDSVKAFICAANSLALGKPGWLEAGVCPDGFLNNSPMCNGALYGQSCVECDKTVKEIALSDVDFTAAQQLADEVISCWNKFRNNNFKDIWCSHITTPTAGTVIYQHGWVIDGYSFKDTLKTRGGEDVNFGWLDMAGFARPLTVGLNFYVCGRGSDMYSPDSKNEVLITFDKDMCNPAIKTNDNEFTCSVRDFELPQNIGSSIPLKNFVEEWFSRYTDPQYLVYYESFPYGEEASWRVNPSSFIIDVVLLGSVLNAVPAVGQYGRSALAASKGALKGTLKSTRGFFSRSFNTLLGKEQKAAISKTTPEMLEALYRRTNSELADEFGAIAMKEAAMGVNEKGYEVLLRSERLYRDVAYSLNGRIPASAGVTAEKAAEELSEKVRASVLKNYKSWPAAYGKMPASEIDAVSKSMSDTVLKEVDDALGSNALKDSERNAIRTAVGKFVASPLTDAELAAFNKQQVVKQFFVKYLSTEAGDGLSQEAMNKLFESVFSKEFFESLSTEAAEATAERAAGHADALVDLTKNGIDEWEPVVIDFGMARDLEKIAAEIEKSNSAAFQRFFFGISKSELEAAVIKAGGKGAVAKTALSRYNPFYITINGKDILVPRALLVDIAVSIGGTAGKTVVAGATLTSDAAYALWRSRAARYSLAYAIGLGIARADADNEKYRPKGGDSIVLQQPYMYDRNHVYSLNKAASDFFVSLFKFEDGKKGYSRFFLASPCKANLVMANTYCSCKVDNNDYILSSNWQPIEPGSVKILSAEGLTKVNRFEDEFKVKQNNLVRACTGLSVIGESPAVISEFWDRCADTVTNEKIVYDAFTKYYYDRVYLPSFKFLKDNALFDKADEFIAKNKPYYTHSALASLAETINLDPSMSSLRSDPNVEFFRFFVNPIGPYDIRDTNQRLYYAFGDMIYPLMVDDSDNIRRSPLEYSAFVDVLSEGMYKFSALKPAKTLLQNFGASYDAAVKIADKGGSYNNPFPDLLRSGNFVSLAANNSYLHYYVVRDDLKGKIDVSNVSKICEFTQGTRNGRIFEQTDFDKSAVMVKCINVQADLASGYNNGNNYCYSTDKAFISTFKYIMTGTAAVIDITAGIAGLGVGAIPAAIFTGTATAWIGYEMDKAQWWPHH